MPKKNMFQSDICDLEGGSSFWLVWQTEKCKSELALMINLKYVLKPSEETFDGFAICNKFQFGFGLNWCWEMVVIL